MTKLVVEVWSQRIEVDINSFLFLSPLWIFSTFIDRMESMSRVPLSDYINRKLNEQRTFSLSVDSMRYYAYEGDYSLASDLSSIDSDDSD